VAKRALKYQVISPLHQRILKELMAAERLARFRLVGGTALTLLFGHRESDDIDLLSDAEYGTIDFKAIERYLHQNFGYQDMPGGEIPGTGWSMFVGDTAEQCIKLDLFHTDPFIRPLIEVDGIRLADPGDIAAMKVEVIAGGGRKKDFWDIHMLLDQFALDDILYFHRERFPWSHKLNEILMALTNFSHAEGDFTPNCLLGKYWELIKLDIMEEVQVINRRDKTRKK
jgi:hypothetical protein